MKGSKIKVVGKSDNGILLPHNIQITENGEPSNMVQKFVFEVEVGKAPLVTMVRFPETIEMDIEGADIVNEIKNLQIFNECKEIMVMMDYDYRLAGKKKDESWKYSDMEFLKEKLDKSYEMLDTVVKQVKKGERSRIDISVFAAKLANYAVILAQRNENTRVKINEQVAGMEETEKEENDKDRKKETG